MKCRVTKKRTFFLIMAITFITIYVVSGCQSQSPTIYYIGLVKKVGMEPLYLAREKKFFKSQGIKVELIKLQESDQAKNEFKKKIIDPLNWGTIDAFVAPLKNIISADNLPPITIVMGISEPTTDNGMEAGDYLAFNQKVVTQSPEDVRKIVNAVSQAIAYRQQNTEETNKIMVPFFQLDTAQYAEELRRVRFIDLARNREYFGTKEDPGSIFEAIPVSAESIISTEFVEKASSSTTVTDFCSAARTLVKENLQNVFLSLIPLTFASLIYNYKTNEPGLLFQFIFRFFGKLFADISIPLRYILPSPMVDCLVRFIDWVKNFFADTTIQFIDRGNKLKINLIHKDGLRSTEENLRRESHVIVHILEPLESQDEEFARTIYKNIWEKEIYYSYIFDLGGIARNPIRDNEDIGLSVRQVLENCIRTIRNILLGFLVEEEPHLTKVLKKENFSREAEHIVSDLFDGIGERNQRLWKRIQKHLTIYIRPDPTSEIFFLYLQGEAAKDCYIRWSEKSSWFVRMDRTITELKVKAYEDLISRYEGTGDKIIDLSGWDRKVQEKIKKVIEEACQGLIPEHTYPAFLNWLYGENTNTSEKTSESTFIDIEIELE